MCPQVPGLGPAPQVMVTQQLRGTSHGPQPTLYPHPRAPHRDLELSMVLLLPWVGNQEQPKCTCCAMMWKNAVTKLPKSARTA